MSTTTLLVEGAGWIGAVLVLGAYALLSAGRLASTSAVYQGMNALGAAGFVVNTAWHGAWPSMVLNIIWAGIGLWVLSRLAMRRRGEEQRG